MISWVLDAKFKKQKSMPTMALEKEVSYSNILVLLFKFHNIIKRLEGFQDVCWCCNPAQGPRSVTPSVQAAAQQR